MHNPKQTAAAMAAVTAYLQEQQAAALAAPRMVPADVYSQLYVLYLQLKTLFEGGRDNSKGELPDERP